MAEREFIFDTLSRSNATLLGEADINHHFKLAYWTNERDRVTYQADKVHTLSYYTKGGEGSRRLDVDRGFGAPNSVSMLPLFHYSDWEITKQFYFAHLYFSDASIRQFAHTTLDIEPRTVDVPEMLFENDQQLVQLVNQLFSQESSLSPLKAEQSIQEVFAYLLTRPNFSRKREIKLTGGLSPSALKKTKEFIQENLHQTIKLEQLANLTHLSIFHFLRMFQVSTGFTPVEFITHLRIQKALQSLTTEESLSDIALNCGFSNQSHLNRMFKKQVGVTPGQYRKAILEK